MADVSITLRPQIVQATLTGGTLRVVVQTGTSAAAGVSSFNSRTGIVNPEDDDYTAAQITETAERVFVNPAQKMAIDTALQEDHVTNHPAPTNRDTRNEAEGTAQGLITSHTHTGTADGPKLAQANTHESPDTDSATTALHHTLGTGANQALPGNTTIPAEYTDADARSAMALPVVALGTISGTQAINWDGEGQVVTATVDGTETTITKGTGWPAANLADVVLILTVSSETAITWSIADESANWPESFETGKHHILIRSVGGTIVAAYGFLAEAIA